MIVCKYLIKRKNSTLSIIWSTLSYYMTLFICDQEWGDLICSWRLNANHHWPNKATLSTWKLLKFPIVGQQIKGREQTYWLPRRDGFHSRRKFSARNPNSHGHIWKARRTRPSKWWLNPLFQQLYWFWVENCHLVLRWINIRIIPQMWVIDLQIVTYVSSQLEVQRIMSSQSQRPV